jgi:hypothetical protein
MATKEQKKIPVENEAARNRAAVIVLSAVAVLLVAGILLMVFLPRITATRQYRRAMKALRQASPEEISEVQLIDLYVVDPDLDFRPLTASVRLNEDDRPDDFRRELLALSDGLRYDGRRTTEVGGFDLEIRFTLSDGTRLDFYLLSEQLYLRVGQINFYFAPETDEDASAYAAFEERARLLLEEKYSEGER